MTYDIQREAESVAGGRDEMWSVWQEQRRHEALERQDARYQLRWPTPQEVAASSPLRHLTLLSIQRTAFPAPMSLLEIRDLYRSSHRTFWQRLPQWRMPW